MQYAAAGDGEGIAAFDLPHAKGNVALQLFEQSLAKLPVGDVLAIAAGERRAIDREDHFERRLIDVEPLQRSVMLTVANRVADLDVFDADDGADIAGGDFIDLDAAELIECVELSYARLGDAAFGLHQGNRLPLFDRAARNATDGDAAYELRPVERSHQHLQRSVGIDLRTGNRLQDHIQQRLHRLRPHLGVRRCITFATAGE